MYRKTLTSSVWLAGLVPLIFVTACGAAAPPKQLLDARAAYKRAEGGVASKYQPAELHVAKEALDRAEVAFKNDAGSQDTLAYSYVAQRKAERADALGEVSAAQAAKTEAAQEAGQAAKKYLSKTERELNKTKSELAKEKVNVAAEKAGRIAAEKKSKELMDALAKSLAVKKESRGTVITLSGSVLFSSGSSTLLAGAQEKLDQVADALKSQVECTFTVEGHTDSVGSEEVNRKLSLDRAEAVRLYLISRGVSGDAINAVGLGPTRPVADNKTADGRANNRRVEIIVKPDKK